MTSLSGIILSSNYVSADDSIIDDVAISVPISCTMMGTGTNTHNDEVLNGTYKANIGTTTLKVYCNDSSGFSIYAIGFTGEQYSGDNTKLIGVNSNQMISTGTAESGNTSNWAMKLATNSGATYPITLQNGFGAYSAVPATYTKVATRATATDVGSSATGAELTTTYASYMSSSQVADTYSGKVKYTLVHPASETPLQPQTTQAGKICYYSNGSNVEGTMGCQTIPASGGSTDTVTPTSATLLASNFSREGYGFAGWSKTFDYSDDTGFLGPQEYIEFPAGTYTGNNDGLSLYARWIKSAGSLQNWSGCSSLQSGAVTALTDQRDNETYAVAKLADGNCWMIENLRLENTETDNTNGTLAQGYDASFAGLANPEELSLFDNITTANSLYSIDGSTDKTISGNSYYLGYRFPRYNNVNTPTTATDRPSNPTTNYSTNNTTNAGMYSYGNYYTWAAAIADTTNYSTNNQSITSTSICPTGWHLPKGGDKSNEINNDFWTLIVAYLNGGTNPANYDDQTYPYYVSTVEAGPVSNALRAYPNNFVYSGIIVGGSVSNRGFNSYYWSSTANSGINAYNLYFISSSVSPGTNNGDKTIGRSIRCLISGS